MPRLRRVNCAGPGFTRRRAGRGFIYLDANDNGVFDADETSAITDSAGHYFLSVAPGDYPVKEVIPAGWYEITAGNNEGDFGNAAPQNRSAATFYYTDEHGKTYWRRSRERHYQP